RWLKSIEAEAVQPCDHLRALAHFGFFVPGKVYRALMGLKYGDQLDEASDALGSAKAALLGLQELRTACDGLSDAHVMPHAIKDECAQRVNWVSAALGQAVSGAMQLVRPGFDEPKEVARLLALDRNGVQTEFEDRGRRT